MCDNELSILEFDKNLNFWIVRAEGGKYFDDFLDDQYIGIRYNHVTINDINSISKDKDLVSVEDIKEIYRRAYSDSNILDKSQKQKLTVHSMQTFLFAFEMKIGDVVLVPSKDSKEFALGVINSTPYDEKINYIEERIKNASPNGLNFKPSNYIKRRHVHWISKLKKQELPSDISWVLSTHYAIINATSHKKQLMPLVSPIFKYDDKYYCRVFSEKGGELTLNDWSKITSEISEDIKNNITMDAEIHSPGFLDFVSSNWNYISNFLCTLGLASIAKAFIGKKNLKEKGIVEWAQDRYKQHLENKQKKIELMQMEEKNFKKSNQESETIAEHLKLKILVTGNEIQDEGNHHRKKGKI